MLRKKVKRNCDEKNFQVNKKKVRDVPEQQFEEIGTFGQSGIGWSKLQNPTEFRIFKNLIFISDILKWSMDIFTLDGFYVSSFKHKSITKPCGIVLNDQIMYITFLRGYSWYLAKVTEFGVKEKAVMVARSLKLACDDNSNVYIACLLGDIITVYDSDLVASNFTDASIPKIQDIECFSQHLILLSDQPQSVTFFSLLGIKIKTIPFNIPFYYPKTISVDPYGKVLTSSATGEWLVSVGAGKIRRFKTAYVPSAAIISFSVSTDSQIYFLLKGTNPHFVVFQGQFHP